MKVLLIIISFLSFTGTSNSDIHPPQEADKCVEKTSSEWGSNCGSCYNSSNSYRVNLRNICENNLDIKLAVQEKAARWRIFNVNNLAPGDSISGYACVGSGKYVFWSRTAGDKSVVFPTDEEIEIEFPSGK